MTLITQPEIDQQVFTLYEYCHGGMDRRAFLARAATLAGAALALKGMLLN